MPLFIALSLAAFSFFVFLGLHIFVWRSSWIPSRGLFLLVKLAIISYGITCLAFWVFRSEPFSQMPVSLPVFACLILLYLHVYVGTYRSLSVRMLEELEHCPQSSMTREQLNRVYPLEWMFTSRLELLTKCGWIIREGDSYHCTRKGAFFARLILFLRSLYGIKHAG